MNGLTFALLLVLAFPACTIRDPATLETRTPAEIGARLKAIRPWEPPLWVLAVSVASFGVAGWWAARSAVHNVSAVLAWFLAKVATFSSPNDRSYRLIRTNVWKALSA
ncbi:hypothetical protein ABZ917_17140 [Nonomuraea wenchangensis]